jgi:HrpA-like RNA helicase/predicted RNA-binding protein with RPS1 domain
MRDVLCKDCLREVEAGTRSPEEVAFSYNEAWARGIVERGGSRSDRCREHRQKHGVNTQGIAVAYIDLETVGEVADRENPTGPLGGLGPLPDAHAARAGGTELEQFGFGMNDDHIREMLDKLSDPERRVLILKAGTGTGKSTFGPYRLMDPPQGASFRLTDLGPIVVTEPRVQAATGVANFVAELSGAGGVGPGYPIGYQVSGDRNHDDACQLVYVTDGTMINWLREGRLSKIGTVIVDEAHERSVNIDFILGYLNRELHRYPHLRVIVTSATFSVPFYEEYFGGPDRVHTMEVPAVKTVGYGMPLFGDLDVPAEGEEHLLEDGSGWSDPALPLTQEDPCDDERFIRAHWPERFAPPLGKDDVVDEAEVGWEEDLWETTRKLIPLRYAGRVPADQWKEQMPEVLASFVVDLARGLDDAGIFGDVLTFLPTTRTIEPACAAVEAALGEAADVFPLISTLDRKRKEEALAARRKGDRRKIVISTNLAETSLTVEGVRFVVDTGIIAQSEWDPELAEGGIPTKPHSQAGIKQRWGRVGRKAPGWVFPLYTKGQYAALAEDTPPGSTRENLEQLVMTAKMGGIDDVVGFPWPAAFEPTESQLDPAGLESQRLFRRELGRADAALRRGGAVDGEGHPTAFGRELNRFQGLGSAGGALAILYADRLACVPEVVTILKLLEDESLVGPGSLLLSDFGWPDEWRVEAAERHRGLAMLCEDDADLTLQICAGWERADPKRAPWEPSRERRDWARRWWVSNDVLLAAAEARRDVLRSFSPSMKEEVKRFVEPALLGRARAVMTRALHGLRYDPCEDGFSASPGAVGEVEPEPEELDQDPVSAAALESDCLFGTASGSVIALRRRRDRDGECHISNLVKLEPWALPEEEADPSTDALRLLVDSAAEVPPQVERNFRTALIESWPVGQRMLMTVGSSDGTLAASDPVEVRAPFERPLSREEAEVEREATRADQSGELGNLRPAKERIQDEEEIEREAFEIADREVALTPCGACAQCLSGHEDLCEDPGGAGKVEAKAEDALHSWTVRAARGEAMHPQIAVEPALDAADDGRERWWEIVGYRLGEDGRPTVLLRPDWRPPGFAGNPARHQDVEPGQPIEVEVGPVVRDHREELRSFVRSDGLGRFVMREAAPKPETQEARGEIAASLHRSAHGLLAGLTEGQALTATVVPARGGKGATVTLLELQRQHLAKASGGPAAPMLSADPGKERGERVEWLAGTVEAPPDEWGKVRVKLALQDSERGVFHRVEVKAATGAGREPGGEAEPDAPEPGFEAGDAVAVRLAPERPALGLGGKDLALVERIQRDVDRRIVIADAPERPAATKEPKGKRGAKDRKGAEKKEDEAPEPWLGTTRTRLRCQHDSPLPRATAAALAELDGSPEWQDEVWSFWARSHHLRPTGKCAIRAADPVEPLEVAAEVEIDERTPLAARRDALAALGDDVSPGEQLTCVVRKVQPKAVFVEVAPGVEGRIAARELSWAPVASPSDLVERGEELRVQVLSLDFEKAELSLTLRPLLPHPFDVFREANPVGAELRGTVARVSEIGAYVDLGDGVEGMVHVSELAWRRLEKPADAVAPGEEVGVQVIGYNEDRRRINLSVKALQPDPFDEFSRANEPGSVVSARVARLSEKSAFVELGDGVQGWVPANEITWEAGTAPTGCLAVDQEVEARILSFDPKRRQAKLSIKRAGLHPFQVFAERFGPGATVTGTVASVTDFGAFVELGGGVQGLIHISKLSTGFVEHPSQVVAPAQRVSVQVLDIDEAKRRVSLAYAGPAA